MPVYLDNAATSYPKPQAVYETVLSYMQNIGVSPGRGTYREARQAEEIVLNTREVLAELFSVLDSSRIIVTSNITESLNLALFGFLRQGDHVITTQMEHNAIWRPLKFLERERGINITALPCSNGCALDPTSLNDAVTAKTRLIALTHASNVTGALMPVEAVGNFCRRYGIPLLVDSAQTAGSYPINVQKYNISLLAFTGHKSLLGPTGTGGLYIAPQINLNPFKYGGTGGNSLPEDQPDYLPDRYEAGTLNTAGLAGLKKSVEFILSKTVQKIRAHELDLTRCLLKNLQTIRGVTIYGPSNAEDRVAVISFNVDNVAPAEVAYVLDEVYDIKVRAGLHCAPQAHHSVGTLSVGAVRVSPGYFNTVNDIELFCRALREITAS